MATKYARMLILSVSALLVLPGCVGKPAAVADPAALNWTSLEDVRQASATATGRSPAAIDVTRSEFRLSIAMAAAEQANSDIPAMQAEATAVAAAVEKLGRTKADLAGVQALSVAFVHQHEMGASHVDDVFDYRRQPNGTFRNNPM